MKKLHFLIVLGVLATTFATAQITLPVDSIPPTLCKTWTVSYALMGDTRIDMQTGAQAMDFDFKRDHTLMVSTGPNDPKTKGTWVYNAASKTIRLTINGQSKGAVTKLRGEQLIFQFDPDSTPEGNMAIKIVYKVKG